LTEKHNINFIFYYFVSEERKAENFIQWIYNNKDDIYAGTAIYKGVRITPDLKITRYQVFISFLVYSAKLSSPLLIIDYHFTGIINLIYSFFTLIFGWWGIPFGPIYTIQVLYRNIRGGTRATIAQILVSQDYWERMKG